jgi:class 3 adenylate cyclase/tetratricopeptide (TPR) repeat protein
MSFIARLQRGREILAQQGRLSTHALGRELGVGDDELEELIEELVDVQQVARREGRILVWTAPTTDRAAGAEHRTGTIRPSPAPADAEARKVVTVVFADLVGSTSLHEQLDAESARRLMERYYGALRAAVEAHGGTVVKLLGDGVMAAFGVPRVAEDDAIRAVRAAMEMVQAVRGLGVTLLGDTAPSPTADPLTANPVTPNPLSVRVAVNTGEVVVSADNTDIVGDPVNVAARLQQEARDGDVLVGESTRRLVGELVTLAPAGLFTLKGRTEAVAAYRVVSLERPAGAAATAFVGRDEELRRITAIYDAAVAERRARLAVVLGSPGLGKSRLLDEVGRRVAGAATVVSARCDATGAATFAPLARALRGVLRADEGGDEALRAAIDAALPGDDTERARITGGIAALLAGTPAPPEETFFVVRRFLAALAATRPVVLAIDDLHWAEPLLLDLVEHLVQWGTGIPLLVLAAARPELRDVRSSLARTGGLVSDALTLAGLDAGAATRLAANVIGADALPAAVAGRVLATSEGNPLFVGELVRMLVADGALKKDGERWTTAVELATLEMPPTIHALLAARIERLATEDRTVLERAAVIGRQFSRAAVAHLLPAELRTHLDARLEALRRTELIEPDTGWFLGEPALRFHHVLTRDAAYRRVLKGTRAELHVRCAEWIESTAGEAIEQQETIGWHLEQAHRHLRELGPIDAHGRALGERASRQLGAAGRRALARDDVSVASNLLGRALHLLDTLDPVRADLALDWCEALLAAGDVTHAKTAIDELGRLAALPATPPKGSGVEGVEASPQTPLPLTANPLTPNRLSAWHTCFAGRLAALTDPQTLHATAGAVAAAADELAAAGDAAGEANAHLVHALALSRLGRVGACEVALDKALSAARRADDRRRANTVLANAPVAALWGPSPVTRASGRCLDVVRVLRITQGAPAVEAVALRCQAVLEALRGRGAAARRMIESSRRMVEELGITQGLLETEHFAGLVALIDGDTAAAEQSLRAAYEGLRQHGLGIDAARAASLLGITLLAQGRAAEAEALSHESEALAGDDLQAAITWRRVRAEALARRGEHTTAVDFARAAVDIAATTDALLDHADARLALAAALRAAGRDDDAAVEEARAIELWEAKGATVLVERARGGAGAVRHVERASAGRGEPVAVHIRPRVRPNAATVHVVRLLDAIAAGDPDVAAQVADGSEVVDHMTGRTWDRDALLASLRPYGAQDGMVTIRIEGLATLGESLALGRQWLSGSGVHGRTWDVGPYESGSFQVIEVDEEGRRARTDLFAANHLSDAVVRLYERYAELLPDGPERERAAATARSVAAFFGPSDFDRYATAVGPDVALVRHNGLVGQGSWRGRHAWLHVVRVIFETEANFTTCTEDIIGLSPEASLVYWKTSGTDRATGGATEQAYLMLAVFGPDGLLTRHEFFAPGHEARALARFEELIGEAQEPLPRPLPETERETFPASLAGKVAGGLRSLRRVPANAATAMIAAIDAAFASRDLEAEAALISEAHEEFDHRTGATMDREAVLTSFRWFMRSQAPTFRNQPLATLGDSLVLSCRWVSAAGTAGSRFDVGPYESEAIGLLESDPDGLCLRQEVFAADRLGDAIARLYERYAELLPAGPERERAAATARSVATLLGPLERWATALAPALEYVDHRSIIGLGSTRGAEAFLHDVIGSLLDLSEGVAMHAEDVVALRPDALLLRWTTSAIQRSSGGVFERPYLLLSILGTDGLVARLEQFDVGGEFEALARFDALTAHPAPLPARRRVRPNAATAVAAGLAAAVARRDAEALLTLFADELEAVEHATRATYGRQGALSAWRSLLVAQDPTCRYEPLATLGDSLALCRALITASSAVGGKFDVGPYEREEITLIEVDAKGRWRRAEGFASERLGDGVVRLYERYAELLPTGPERERAAATARSVAAMMGPYDPDHFDAYARAFAPGIQLVDHRTLGTWFADGADAALRNLRSVLDLTDDMALRDDDVLALRGNALLVRRMISGTDRASGGAFERPQLGLFVFGADGLVTRWELFDVGHEVEALTRFDEQPAPATPARAVRRRVRPNAATANAARVDAAVAARDLDALSTLASDDWEILDHTTGTTWDREADLRSFRYLLRSEAPTYRHEALATLGDSLALCRQRVSASGFAGGSFDVGAYTREMIGLTEVDAQGRHRRGETFDNTKLGDAIVRLYERYAELLPDGPEQERAAATARSVAALPGQIDLDIAVLLFAPAVRVIDHRTLGTWSAGGVEQLLRHWRALLDLSADVALRFDDILDLRPDALLCRVTTFGTDRAGGAFEQQNLALLAFGVDGRVTRLEAFDLENDTEALARFDALVLSPAEGLTVEPPAARPARRVRANAATALAGRLDAAIVARDAEALSDLFAEDFGAEDHITHTPWDRRHMLASFRTLLLAQDPTCRNEPLATLGDSLALCRVSMSAGGLARGSLDVGAYEKLQINLIEVDAKGRWQGTDAFAADRLGDAIVRLYERYAELLPDGPARTRIMGIARSVALALRPFDLDRYAEALEPAIEIVDHRTLGTWSARGAEEFLRHSRAWLELAGDLTVRFDNVLALQPEAFLISPIFSGTDRSGGAYEAALLALCIFGADGRHARIEWFDPEREAEALARFDELTAPRAPARVVRRRVRANAATEHGARLDAAVAARDVDALAALFADHVKVDDHTTGIAYDYDHERGSASYRSLMRARDPKCRHESLATLGDSLALFRLSLSASGMVGRTLDVGPYEKVEIHVIEVDAQGRGQSAEIFAIDHLGDAIVRLYERFAELLPDGPARTRIMGIARSVALTLHPFAPDRYGETIEPAIEVVDHRTLGTWSARGAEEFLRHMRAMFDLAEDAAVRYDDVLALQSDAFLVSPIFFGTARASGGAFETALLALCVFGADGRHARIEWFDLEQAGEALARFDELGARNAAGLVTAPPTTRIENAATRAAERYAAAWQALDIERFAALHAPGFRNVDRRRIMSTDFDRDQFLESFAFVFARISSTTVASEQLATRGDRLALFRMCVRSTEPGCGPSEVAFLQIFEVDALGRVAAGFGFDPDDLDAAYAELDDRYAAGEAAPFARNLKYLKWLRHTGYGEQWDEEQWAAWHTADFVLEDHRPVGALTLLSRDESLASVRALLNLRPDARLRMDHVLALEEWRSLMVVHWEGSEAEGTFEIPMVVVTLYSKDETMDAILRRNDVYSLDQLDEARACYEKLAAKARAPRIENAATRAADRFKEAWQALDTERFAALHAPDFRNVDRRRIMSTDLGRDEFLDSFAFVFAKLSSATVASEVLATRGDRLALFRMCVRATEPGSGPSEVAFLQIFEVDALGRIAAGFGFDPDDLDAAYAELDHRYAAGEAAPYPRAWETSQRFERATAARDWAEWAAVFAPDYLVEDHRLLGWGTLHSRDEYMAYVRALVDLAPDATTRLEHVLALDDRRTFHIRRWVGTREGGPFEMPLVGVSAHGPDGRIQRSDIYDLDQLDEARARFEQLPAPNSTQSQRSKSE